jgi:hypothetical protein
MKMGPMVHHHGLRNTKLRNNMIEHEKRNGVFVVRKGRQILNPFSELVNNNDDVAMTIS